MSRYDGLIIPRSYSEYINKTDAATLSQALQLSGVMDAAPTANSVKPVKSGGVYDAIKGMHSIPRAESKDLTQYITDGTLWKRLAGTDGFSLFEDLYVGDYIHMSRAISAPNSVLTGSEWVTIADLDGAWGRGQSTYINYHHAIMVPGKRLNTAEKQHFGFARMNSSDSTSGGYAGSEMYTTTIGAIATTTVSGSNLSINQQLFNEFGSHLKSVQELVSNRINGTGYNRFGSASGCSDSRLWVSVQAVLMSEIEVYGSIVWSSSGYDTGSACRQLALFQQSEVARNNRSAYYWLKDVASASSFCFVSDNGLANFSNASNSYCVRPRFILA